MRREAYSDLIGFTPLMAEIAPDAVVALAKAELMKELPHDRFLRLRREARERREWLDGLRAIPEKDRTPLQERALDSAPFEIHSERYD